MRSHGVTLIELLLVVSILGIVALVAVPNLSPGGAKRLDAAAAEIVAALRYARSEAMRTGTVHGIEINKGVRRIIVFRADLSTDPVTPAAVLLHPVTRKPWNIDLTSEPMTSGVSIGNEDDLFHFYPDFRLNYLLFEPGGAPVWIDTSSGTTWTLREGTILLDYRTMRRTVRVASLSGRVTVE